MRTTKKISFTFLLAILLSSCIERFYIDSETDFVGKIVINGTITDDGNVQEITISRSTSPELPQFSPISGCSVQVNDDHGNSFYFYENTELGHYEGNINPELMLQNAHYQLIVTTPDGKEYQSEIEELLPCPEIDSVYFALDTKKTTEADENGLQFYLDFSASEQYGSFYRWELIETYEYHSTWPIFRYLDVDGYHEGGTDYSYFICYQTEKIGDIFTLSTQELTKNEYKKYPLHFVNDHTQRLLYQYHLLVKQYSISEGAFHFWENLKKNNQEEVDLFSQQPANVQGNIFNVNDPSEVVLGYFGASSVKTKRTYVLDVPELTFEKVNYCEASPILPGEMIPSEPRPLYMVLTKDSEGNQVWGYAASDCFICTLKGGTTEKPSFWIER